MTLEQTRPSLIEKQVDLLDITAEQIISHLGLDSSSILLSASTTYGSGRGIRLGGEENVYFTWFVDVWNFVEEKPIKKSSPTVTVHDDIFPHSYEVGIERVERVEFVEGAVRFTGTTGSNEGVMQVRGNGEVVFLARPSSKADKKPSVGKETKDLGGEMPEGYLENLLKEMRGRVEIVPIPEEE